jgi:ABC-type transport system involved in multi-copper enzyme maturation permease subunit
MIPLLLLELRRQRPMAVRMAWIVAAVVVVFYLAGKRAPSDLLAIVIGSAVGVVMMVPMGISRDKMEGTLDFVCGLPVEPRAIAASRFAAVALLSAPWAAVSGVVAAFVPQIATVNPVGVAMVMWLAMLLVGTCGTALTACFELETLLGAPFVATVIVLLILPRVVRALLPGITAEVMLRFVQRPSAPFVLGAVLLAAVAILGSVAFAASARGFANYRPDAARR